MTERISRAMISLSHAAHDAVVACMWIAMSEATVADMCQIWKHKHCKKRRNQ